MKKYFLSAATILFLAGHAVQAQEPDENSKPRKESRSEKSKKFKDTDEIVIKRKDGDKDTRITIEIRDDQVIVNGQPIENFENDDIAVLKREPLRLQLMSPASPFRFPEGTWSQDGAGIMFNDGRERPFLGVATEGSTEGAKITNITEGSAAAKAGLKEGDIITRINDKEVYDHEQLSEAIKKFKPKDKISITYERAGKEIKTTATLGSAKNSVNVVPPGTPQITPELHIAPGIPDEAMDALKFRFDQHNFDRAFNFGKPRIGIKVQDTEEGKGVKVLEVDKESAGEKSGIKENDIITSFDGKDVNSADELAKASQESKDKSSVKIQLKRNGRSQTVELRIPKKLKTAQL